MSAQPQPTGAAARVIEQAPQKSRFRIPGTLKAAGCAAGMACTAAQVRPAPQDCPSANVAAMRASPGPGGNVLGDEVDLFMDINQPGGRGQPGTYRAGPITGQLAEGPREWLKGRVWGQLWLTEKYTS